MNDYSPTLGETFADAKRRVDFDDLQNELAGRDTGKARRFLTDEQFEDRRPGGGSATSRRTDALSRLQALLASNPVYAALYSKTFDALRNAERAAEEALAHMAAALENTNQQLNDMRDRAARLPDGTRVFKDKNGEVWTEHGERVAEADAAAIHWRGDEPAWEDFSSTGRARDRIEQGMERIRQRQVDTLGRYREEFSDERKPPSEKRLEKIGEELEEFERTLATDLAPVHTARELPLKQEASLPLNAELPKL